MTANLLVLGGALLATQVVDVIVTALLAARMGVEVTRARRFIGPELTATSALGVRWELGAIPLGGFVEFAPLDPGDASAGTVLDRAPRGRQLLLATAPWLVLLVIASALLGPIEALSSFGLGFVQFFAGILVWSEGPVLVGVVLDTIRTAPPHVLAGLVLAKLCAFNLLPVPSLSGARALRAITGLTLPPWTAVVAPLCALGWIASLVLHLWS